MAKRMWKVRFVKYGVFLGTYEADTEDEALTLCAQGYNNNELVQIALKMGDLQVVEVIDGKWEVRG